MIIKIFGLYFEWTTIALKQRSCTAKVKYGHHATALRAAYEQREKRKLFAYKCRHCDGYHLSSQDRPA